LTRSLVAEKYYVDESFAQDALKNCSKFNILDQKSPLKIDFIIHKNDLYARKAFDRKNKMVVQGVAAFVSTLEDLILAKLNWVKESESVRQLRDIAMMLKVGQGNIDFKYLNEWIYLLDVGKQWKAAKELADISE